MRQSAFVLFKALAFLAGWIFMPKLISFEYTLATTNPVVFLLSMITVPVLIVAIWHDVSRMRSANRAHYAERLDLLRYKAAEEERNEIS